MRHEPQAQKVFGRYLLLEELAEGGMAQIWRARLAGRDSDGGEVVVKTLHPRLVDQPLFADLFAAEARITRLLSHPGIVRLVDEGAVKRMPYLAMERVDGWDLATLTRALPAGDKIPVDIAITIGLELCRAVGFAHAWRDEKGKPRPIVHGDLSPSNLMVRRDGGVTLIDFGVAHMSRRAARARAHLLIGKSGYLAPELLDNKPADARSDVFSAGVVLHELLTGRYLFVDQSERETLRRVSEQPIAPPSRHNPHVTRGLDAIVLRALSRDPAQRFASANELADALDWLRAPVRASHDRVAAYLRRLFAEPPRSLPVSAAHEVRVAPPPQLMTAEAARPRRRRGGTLLRAAFAVVVMLAAFMASSGRLKPTAAELVDRADALFALQLFDPPAPQPR
ncbi:MAG TPA: serine/threonine-protein kinase [Polyangia bacterium]|nr:serine/threonine-protein kinase [Polyangia bacterium]